MRGTGDGTTPRAHPDGVGPWPASRAEGRGVEHIGGHASGITDVRVVMLVGRTTQHGRRNAGVGA